jgi:hypothetical protein
MAALYASEPGYAGARAGLLEAARPFLDDGLPLLREQARDEHGRFAPGGGSPDTGGGVRAALAQASTLDELNAAAEAEAERITGRHPGSKSEPVKFSYKGSDLQIAREHTEGILRGLERFPNAPLRQVSDYDGFADWGGMQSDAMAFASMGYTQGSINFNTYYSGDPARYGRALFYSGKSGHLTDATTMGVATHEFGHILTSRHGDKGTPPKVPAKKIATEMRPEGKTTHAYVHDQISEYAAANSHELNAEAFADVVSHGAGAAPLSAAIYEQITALYPPGGPPPPNPYGR